MRLKILLLISVITLLTTVWAWIENPRQIEFVATKNRRLVHERTKEIMATTNIDSLKAKTFQVIKQLDDRNLEKELIRIKVQNLLTITILLSVTSTTLLTIAIRKTNP